MLKSGPLEQNLFILFLHLLNGGIGIWVFAYGSLMWNPGFPYEESVCATLTGGHRALCIYSVRHRGCSRRPGLVLGLDTGGRCQGLAFRVSPGHERQTRHYLRIREQSTLAYKEVLRPVQLDDNTGRQIRAICYMANRNHTQYAGIMKLENQANMVRNSSGKSGHNIDYYFNTVRHLKELGIVDKSFFRLSSYLGGGINKTDQQSFTLATSGHRNGLQGGYLTRGITVTKQ